MKGGYGQIHWGGITAYAHRVAWELKNGPINDLYVLHRCDNRKCVNPDHLFLGTFDENMADMVAKKRQAHGTRNGHAKLSDEDILDIKRSTELQANIATKYGVTQGHISAIRSGKTRRIISEDIVFSELKDSAA